MSRRVVIRSEWMPDANEGRIGKEIIDEAARQMREQGLVSVVVDLPRTGTPKEPGSESFWAKPLAQDLYELQNVPFFAYDLHLGDVVRATASDPDRLLKIREVVSRGGHKTLRVFFDSSISDSDRLAMLEDLRQWGGTAEQAWGRMFSVDVEPSGDYGAVCDRLWAWEKEGKLAYETGATK